MDATIGFPGTIARPRPSSAIRPVVGHRQRARGVAATIAIAVAILAAVAGGVIDGAAGTRPDGPAPHPLPGPDIVL